MTQAITDEQIRELQKRRCGREWHWPKEACETIEALIERIESHPFSTLYPDWLLRNVPPPSPGDLVWRLKPGHWRNGFYVVDP